MGGSTTPVSQTTRVERDPNAERLMNLAYPGLESFVTQPPQLPGFSGVAGFDPLQTQGQEQVLGANSAQQGVVSGAANATNRLTSGELLTPDANPALRATIDASTRPIIDDLLTKALPSIRGEAVTTGNYGGTRQGVAEGLATGRAAQAVGDTAAKVATTGYGQGLDALQRGIALAPSTASAQLIPGLATSGVGDVRQALQQALLGEQTGRFNYEQLLPFLAAKDVAGIAQGIPNIGATTTGTAAAPNPLLQGLGLGISGLGALGSLGGSAGLAGLMTI